MTRLLRSCLLVLTLLAATLQAKAQTSNCRITLDELGAPVACLCGPYRVGYTVSCQLPGSYVAVMFGSISVTNPNINRSDTITRAFGAGNTVTINIPCTLDTNRIYYIQVFNPATGIASNVKSITVQQVDQSPKPQSTIAIVGQGKTIYCPKDTLTLSLTSLVVARNYPPATFQWLRNGTVIPGQDRDRVRVTNLKPNDCFSLLVTKGAPCAINDTGSSNKICINVKEKPTVSIRLVSGSGCADTTTVLALDTANAGRGATFQWFKNGVRIPGITGINFTLQPGFANCRDKITARVITTDCPDTATANPFTVGSCGKVRVDNVVPTAFCAGDSLRVSYTTFACFEPGNVFTFQLSDSTGSFAGVTYDAGSKADTASGAGTALVPSSVPSGSGYRLRILSSSPTGISINSFGPLRIFARPQDVVPGPQNVRCGPGPVTVRVSSAGATGFAWYTAQVGGVRVTRPGGQLVTTDTFTLNVTRDTTFYVEAINANGCRSAMRTPVPVQVGQPIQVSAGPDQFACERGPAVQLIGGSPTGGTYSGLGAASGSVNGSAFEPGVLPADTYTVKYLYVSPIGCRDSANKRVIIQPTVAPNAGNDTTICATTAPTQFQLGGFSPAGGRWGGSNAVSNGGLVTVALLDTFNILTYTTTSDNGCPRSDTIIIRVNRGPQVSVTTTLPSVCNTPTGTATVNPFNSNYTYTFTNAATNDTVPLLVQVGPLFTGFAAGAYVLTADDGRNCPSRTTFVINDPLGPVVTLSGLAAQYCSTDPCDTITVDVAGGRFTLNPPSPVGSPLAIDSLTGVFCPQLATPGQVTVIYTVRNALGCLGSAQAVTTVNQVPGAASEADTTVCANSGLIALSGGGVWSGTGVQGTGGTQFFNPMAAGVLLTPDSNVIIKQVTAGNCSTSITKVIRVLSSPTPVIAPTGTVALCQGGSVTVTTTIAGLTLPSSGVSLSLINTATGQATAGSDSGRFVVFAPGTYRVVAFAGSCSDTSDATLTITTDSLGTVSAGPDTSICRNAGLVTLTGTPAAGNGLTGTFTGPGVAGTTFNPAAIDSLTQQVTIFYTVQRGACRDSARRIITLLDAPTATLTASTLSSCQTPITLTAGPAGAGVTYIFLRGTDTVQNSSSPIYVADSSGAYTVTVRVPSSTCPAVSPVVNILISQPPVLPALTAIFACEGDPSIPLETPTGATSFTWSGSNGVVPAGGTYVFNPQTAGRGTFTLKLVVFNGACRDSATKAAVVGAAPVFTVRTTQTSSCDSSNGTATVVFNAPAGVDTTNWQVTFSGDVQVRGKTAFNIPQGTFSATVEDTLTGCSMAMAFTITAPNSFNASLRNVPTGFCTEELPFVLDTANASPAGGQYFLYNLTNPAAPVRRLNPAVISNLAAGRYRLIYTVTNASNCIGLDTADFSVNSPSIPVVTVDTPPGDTICQGNTVTLRVANAAGRSIQWLSSGQPLPGATADTLLVSQPGVYTARVDSAGCSRTSQFVSIFVRANPTPSITVVNGNAQACQGQRLTLVASTGTAFRWFVDGRLIADSTRQQISVATGGNYTVEITNGTCTATSQPLAITFNPLPAANAGPNRQVCVSSPPIAITGFSPALGTGVSFVESYITGDQFSPSAAGTGSKTVTLQVTQNGCTAFDTAVYTVVPGFAVTIDPTSALICAQTVQPLTPTISPATPGADYTFQWYRNGRAVPADSGGTDSVYQSNAEGRFYVVVTTSNTPDQCAAQSVETAISYFPFTPPNAGNDITVCSNAPVVQLSGTPTGGVWSGPGVEANGRFTPSPSVVGVNRIVFTTNQGQCTLTDTVLVTVNGVPNLAVTATPLVPGQVGDAINIFDSVQLSATGADTYLWTPSNSVSSATAASVIAKPLTTTTYTVIGTSNGCSDSTTIQVVVNTDVRVSNGFSPNGDGQNDVWNIFNIQAYPNADIRVYNRWGAEVYKAKGSDYTAYSRFWDGTSDGKDVPVGAYYYTIDLNNNQKPFIGSVTVVR